MFQKELLQEKCKQIGVSLSEEQLQQFAVFYDLLIEKNKVMNLTAITEMEDVINKHFVDSLLLSNVLCLQSNLCVADLGTGAGFPGIPLKIAFPNLKITLMDSLKKRLTFLDEVITTLGLQDIETVHGRAEDLGKNKAYREQYDLCVSRAVANLSTLSEYCLPLVKVGGNFVSYKSGKIEEELIQAENAIYLLGGKKGEVIYHSIPDTDMERSFVTICKEKETPKKYPRKAGVPSKESL
ncbi:MAG: 16S rRNA (guanine(527)-N(7))-methyltransferase RsmG [Lachnospiraceae bacterium]|nr:16S rRNA (guanine(527)-N(7))-methyltransferase RsmG [Lachnospiraceae bacterium]